MFLPLIVLGLRPSKLCRSVDIRRKPVSGLTATRSPNRLNATCQVRSYQKQESCFVPLVTSLSNKPHKLKQCRQMSQFFLLSLCILRHTMLSLRCYPQLTMVITMLTSAYPSSYRMRQNGLMMGSVMRNCWQIFQIKTKLPPYVLLQMPQCLPVWTSQILKFLCKMPMQMEMLRTSQSMPFNIKQCTVNFNIYN